MQHWRSSEQHSWIKPLVHLEHHSLSCTSQPKKVTEKFKFYLYLYNEEKGSGDWILLSLFYLNSMHLLLLFILSMQYICKQEISKIMGIPSLLLLAMPKQSRYCMYLCQKQQIARFTWHLHEFVQSSKII